MSYQRCLATHTANPPQAFGGLRLCTGDYDDLTDALTGRTAAATDSGIDAVWGVREGNTITVHDNAASAIGSASLGNSRARAEQNPDKIRSFEVVCGDGTDWFAPRDYRPGGLARDWAALQLREKTIRTGEPAPYVAGGAAEAPLPIDAGVADIRMRIEHAIRYWVHHHVVARNLTYPTLATVYQATTWLARHRIWAASQDWAGTYADNLRELRTHSRSTIDLPQPRTFEVGPCICWVDGHHCTGTLRTIAREPRDPTPVVIRCDTCPAAYDSTQWKRLGERLNQMRPDTAA